jgi:hypothetical protein
VELTRAEMTAVAAVACYTHCASSPWRWLAMGASTRSRTSKRAMTFGRQLLYPDPRAEAAKAVGHTGRRSTKRLKRWSETRQTENPAKVAGFRRFRRP